MALSDPHPVEGCDNVQLRKDLCFADGVEGFLDQRNRVTALQGDVVDSTVVDTDSDITTRLLRQQQWRGGTRFRGLDEAFGEVLVKLPLDDYELHRRERVVLG